ncbi:hypothetical protein HJG60_008000 [Phyllostomus discolor]|uniref:Uncharacterized protein n=1 Tax=Phyllostomus discolor TaxID=89673 RepID=A0A834EVS4_9CHIR|nr:hypothetical protein HJG60_008000 [Phyllostomus discolor]
MASKCQEGIHSHQVSSGSSALSEAWRTSSIFISSRAALLYNLVLLTPLHPDPTTSCPSHPESGLTYLFSRQGEPRASLRPLCTSTPASSFSCLTWRKRYFSRLSEAKSSTVPAFLSFYTPYITYRFFSPAIHPAPPNIT